MQNLKESTHMMNSDTEIKKQQIIPCDVSSTRRISAESPILRSYLLPGMPQPLLTPGAHLNYQKLRDAYENVRREVDSINADVILIYSEMWTSVIGHQIQALPEPQWTYVDEEFHDLGSINYKFRMDADLAHLLNVEAQTQGLHSRTVAYEGFPLDTGTIVALKLINPENRLPALVLSSNIYADRAETGKLAAASVSALEKSGKKAVAIIISNLSKNMHLDFIRPEDDHIFSEQDEIRNRELLKLLEDGKLDQFVHREHYNLRPFWWMEALLDRTRHESQVAQNSSAIRGKTIEYVPVWGCGCAIVSLAPSKTIVLGVNKHPIFGETELSGLDLV